jgi:hypothetical protein
MSKGIAVHILITIVYIIICFWIFDGVDVGWVGRAAIVFTCIWINGMVSSGLSELYKQKL